MKALRRAILIVLTILLTTAAEASSEDAWRADVVRLLHDGRFVEAEEAADRAGERVRGPAPAFFRALAGYWRLLYDSDDAGLQADFEARLGRAIREAEALVETSPEDPEGRLFLGTSQLFLAELRARQRHPFAAAREFRRARGALERALSLDPAAADARFGLGTLEVVAGRAPTLARGIASLFGVSGNSEVGLEHLAVASRDGKILALESAITLLTVHSNRRAPDYSAAERGARDLAARSSSLVAIDAAARVLLSVGDPEGAARLLDAALERLRDAPLADRSVTATLRFARARTRLALFRPDLALEDLRRLAAVPGPLPRSVREDSAALLRDAAVAGARPPWLRDLASRLGTVVSEDAATGAAANSFARALPALDLLGSGAAAEASARLSDLAAGAPDDAILAALAGKASLSAGRVAEARRWLDRASASARLPRPWTGPCLLLAGMAADLEGDRGTALALYRRAAEAPGFASRDAAVAFQERPYRTAT